MIQRMSGPLSVKTLDTGYWAAVYGSDEPNILRCSPNLAQRMRETLGNNFKAGGLFNNAVIVEDKTIEHHKIRFENTSHPFDSYWTVEVELT